MPLRLFVCFAVSFGAAQAQAPRHPIEIPEPAPEILTEIWDAQWITPPATHARIYGVHHFRKTFDLDRVPTEFVVNVSADNRYRLFVNGHPVNVGPARGDLRNWRFDTLDLAPWLQAGRNVVAAKVWNFGEHGPVAQETDQTAFILQGNTDASAAINTNNSWVVLTNDAYTPITDARSRMWTYIVVGPGDDVAASRYPWGWEQPEFDDTYWAAAATLRRGYPKSRGTDGRWPLVPRQIPLMENKPLRLQRVRRVEGTKVMVSDAFVRGKSPIVIPPHSQIKILFDQNEHTTAYPQLTVEGGAGSSIQLTYAESLYEGEPSPANKVKGHRDEVDGKFMLGFRDIFRPDGPRRTFRPLRWRTYRYLEIAVETTDAPLTLVDYVGEFTAYPFEERAAFASDDATLDDIWEIAWRTLRTGTHEIYTDSSYYEQLSYVGDTRIEALVSLYVSGDDRLMRKSIDAFGKRRDPNGLTTSRWPDSRQQIIPPYSLVWISMVHDYWMHRNDPHFVRRQLPGVREVLRFFAERSDPATGFYRVSEWWNYVDWIPEWGRDPVTGLGGVPPLDDNQHSAIIDLQHAYTLRQAAELMAAFGDDHYATIFDERRQHIREQVYAKCWNEKRQLLADNSRQETFSQHVNSFWILSSNERDADFRDMAERMLTEDDVTPATFYFSFYSHRAFVAAGLGDRYSEWLEPWRGALAQGLTTVPERPSPDTRSDAHAWGAHPILGMLQTMAGIRPGSPGFATVAIAPHFGSSSQITARMPHPKGEIEITLKRDAFDQPSVVGHIVLPAGLSGVFHWQDKTLPLAAGINQIAL